MLTFVLYCILTFPRETALLCCKVAVSTTNLQLKQFNVSFDTCIFQVHLLPLCTSKIWIIQDFGCIESEYLIQERDNEQLKEYVNALFKDNFSL